MNASFNRFTIKMTRRQAESASHQGQCTDDVASLLRVPQSADNWIRFPPIPSVPNCRNMAHGMTTTLRTTTTILPGSSGLPQGTSLTNCTHRLVDNPSR